MYWTIEPDYAITFTPEPLPTEQAAEALPDGTAIIVSKEDFDTYAADLTREKLQELYNSIPGVVATKRLRNRPTAIERIWEAMRTLPGGKDGPEQEPKDFGVHKPAAKSNKAPRGARQKAGKAASASTPPSPTRKPDKSRQRVQKASKKALALAMIRTAGGATCGAIMKRFGWQPHTVRGLFSTLNSKGLAKITSFKDSKGNLAYRAE